MKELYIDILEERIGELMDTYPALSWDEAYEIAGNDAYHLMRERLADMADNVRKRPKP